MTETVEQEEVVEEQAKDFKPKPKRKASIGDKVFYWRPHQTERSTPNAPDEFPCLAFIVGYAPSEDGKSRDEGRVNLVVFSHTGTPSPRHGISFSDIPKGNHWTRIL